MNPVIIVDYLYICGSAIGLKDVVEVIDALLQQFGAKRADNPARDVVRPRRITTSRRHQRP